MKLLHTLILIILVISFISPVSALIITVDVPEKYSSVAPGERVYFEIDIKYPENPSRKDLILEYELVNEEKKIIARSDTLRAIETQLSLIDSVVVPENINSGLYSIDIRVRDVEGLNKEAGASFNVSGDTNWPLAFFLVVFLCIIIYLSIKLKGVFKRFFIKIKIKRIVRKRQIGDNSSRGKNK